MTLPVLSRVAEAVRAGPKLRDYQQKLFDDIHNAWSAGHRNVLAVLPTGGGKTLTFSSIVREHHGASCVIAHRQELVSQISVALARNGVRHRIIGPNKLIRMIVALQMVEVGVSYYDPQAPCAVAGVDTLVRRGEKLASWLPTVTLWIQDECFTGDTMITTPKGKVRIDSIHTGDIVTAFDEVSGVFVDKRVTRTFKNKAHSYMFEVVTSSHHMLKCTSGHPFYTRRGWVDAKDLNYNDEVLLHDVPLHKLRYPDNRNHGRSAVSIQENGEDLLQTSVRLSASGQTSETTSDRVDERELFGMRWKNDCVRLETDNSEKEWSSVLQQNMLDSIQSACFIRDYESYQSEICKSADERKQSDERPSSTSKDVRNTQVDRSQAICPRWERSWSDETGANVNECFVDSRVRTTIQSVDRSVCFNPSVSETLQDRFSRPGIDDSCGNRREQSLCDIETGTGQEERVGTVWVGLESITIHQSSSLDRFGDGHVYNIEVEDVHTYVANDVVVHNCHHVLRDNKWGKAAAMFPNAKGLGVTATPCRADGNGLGRHAQGLMDVMVEGPTMRELIRRGYLTEYRIICPPSDLSEHMGGVKTSATTGDYNEHDIRDAVASSGLVAHDEGGSRVVGDIVSTYKQRFMGMLSVVFVPGVAMAEEIAQQFRDEGISAVALSANTPDDERAAALRKMKRREIHVITNAALFSEGTDIPALEVVQDAYPTQSLGMFMQRFGRVLRLMEGKTHGIYCDHAANVKRHGLPDKPREWTLDAREKRSSAGPNDAEATRVCMDHHKRDENGKLVKDNRGAPIIERYGCYAVFERFKKACPYCDLEIPPPADRSGPEFVDGDLYELDEATLAAMRGEVARVDAPVVPPLTPEALQAEINRYRKMLQKKHTLKRHELHLCKLFGAKYESDYEADRQAHIAQKEAVTALREVMAEWGGYHRAAGRDDGEIMRRFYVAYGVDWLSAQALSADAACELMMRVAANVGEV